MSYNVTINGKDYELAKCTLDVEEKLEALRDSERGVKKGTEKKRAYIKKMYAYIESCLGPENLQEALECTSIEDVDVKELEMCAYNIAATYSQKLVEKQLDDTRKLAADMTRTLQGTKIGDLMAAMSAKE